MKQNTQEDLSAVRVLRTTLSEIVNAIGELHLNKLILNAQLKQLDVEISQQEYKFEEFQNNERV